MQLEILVQTTAKGGIMIWRYLKEFVAPFATQRFLKCVVAPFALLTLDCFLLWLVVRGAFPHSGEGVHWLLYGVVALLALFGVLVYVAYGFIVNEEPFLSDEDKRPAMFWGSMAFFTGIAVLWPLFMLLYALELMEGLKPKATPPIDTHTQQRAALYEAYWRRH